MTELTGHTAVVVGGSGGIGRAVALDLMASGAVVAVIGRDRDALREVTGDESSHLAVEADVTDEAALSAAFERIRDRWKRLDLAVNTVGMLSAPAPAGELSRQDLERTLLTNVVGIHAAMRHEIGLMKPAGRGAIVNLSANIGPHTTRPGFAAYGASKAAVSALTRAAALDHVGDGIRINAISPGPSDTTMSMRPGETPADRDARMAETNPSGRVARLGEIVAAVRFLLSDAAAYAVGTDLVIDGGASA